MSLVFAISGTFALFLADLNEKSAWFSYDAKPSRKIHHAFVSPSQVLWLKLVIIRFALFAKWNVIMEMTVKTAKKDVLKPAKLLELRNFNFPYLDVKDRAESKIQFARFKICRNYQHWASFIFLLQIILYEVFFYSTENLFIWVIFIMITFSLFP